MTNPVHPPPYKPTDTEHNAAYMRWCLQTICDDHLLTIRMLDEGCFSGQGSSERALSKERETRIKRLLDMLFAPRGREDNEEAWDGLWTFDKNGLTGLAAFKVCQEQNLAGAHCGDCVAVSGSCLRCIAEELYKVPSTVTWQNKSAGWHLYNKYLDDNKHKE